MGLFTAKETFSASGEFIPMAMRNIREAFSEKGYKYNVKSETCNRTIIEVQRGSIVHQAFGLRNGLEITFTRKGEQTEVEVRDCLIENQVVGPAILFRYVPKLRIPVAVTEGVGLCMQATLPRKAMDAIAEAYEECTGERPAFCPFCGARVSRNDHVCGSCGKRILEEVAVNV